MPNVFGADPSLTSQRLTLLTSSRALVRAQVIDVTSSAFDHVIRSVTDFPAAVAGVITLTTGSWAIAAPINLGTDQILIPAGTTVYMQGIGWDKVLTTTGDVLTVDGTLVAQGLALTGGNNGIVLHAGSEAFVTNCRIHAAASCIRNNGCDQLSALGGYWTTDAGAGYGYRHSGNTAKGILLANILAEDMGAFVHRASGTASSVTISGCTTISSTWGVNWPAASIPTQGMLIVGSAFNSVAPLNGFTEASARVNVKACLGSAGLLSETPIVP